VVIDWSDIVEATDAAAPKLGKRGPFRKTADLSPQIQTETLP
jgi:hypothetical protein